MEIAMGTAPDLSTTQAMWDAHLIRAWRRFHTLGSLMYAFAQSQGANTKGFWMREFTDEWRTKLKRFVPVGLHPSIQTRVFMDSFLPKVHNYLLEHSPEHDVRLLMRLQTSDYDTLKRAVPTSVANEKKRLARRIRNATEVIKLNTTIHSERNSGTNGNVVKGRVRPRVLRGKRTPPMFNTEKPTPEGEEA